MEFSRQEYWRGLPFPSPEDLPSPGIKPGSPALQADSLSLSCQGGPSYLKVAFKCGCATFRDPQVAQWWRILLSIIYYILKSHLTVNCVGSGRRSTCAEFCFYCTLTCSRCEVPERTASEIFFFLAYCIGAVQGPQPYLKPLGLPWAFFFPPFFNWSVIALHCCVSFCYTTTCTSPVYTCTPPSSPPPHPLCPQRTVTWIPWAVQ